MGEFNNLQRKIYVLETMISIGDGMANIPHVKVTRTFK